MADSQDSNVEFFRNLVEIEKKNLTRYCVKWKETIDQSQDIPQDIEGDILVAIGQAQLLMRERFSQFSGLIDDCEFKRGEKETTTQDLQGFWDIVYFQVEDVNKKFKNLLDLQMNSWKEPEPKVIVQEKRKAPFIKSHPSKLGPQKSKFVAKSASSSMRAHILAARQKMKNASASSQKENIQVTVSSTANHSEVPKCEDKENVSIPEVKVTKSPEKNVFDAGFFKVVTPVKTSVKSTNRSAPISLVKGKILSSSLLKERVHNTPVVHKDYSPCMRITRSMKAQGLRTKLHFQ